jgi:SAM-dependent methyltransferase
MGHRARAAPCGNRSRYRIAATVRHVSDLYDRIGTGYATTRSSDPRIARLIELALGDSVEVVNVGAGTGSYEPAGLRVTAVEPSAAMIVQRPPGAAPVVRAHAERLPFSDGSFDAAMATLTLHHWSDWRAGVAEMRRVSRGVIVVLTWDPDSVDAFWLTREYFREQSLADAAPFPRLEELLDVLGGGEARPVPIARDCRDGFMAANWARPEAYLDPAVRANISTFARRSPDELRPGLDALARDLETGEWDRRHGRLRTLPELDLGYRMVVSGRNSARS